MRVTHQLIKQTVINNVHRNMGQMNRLQNMLSTGRALHRPSDDPIKVAQVMGFTASLARNGQYQKNIDAATSWLGVTEDSLERITEVLQRAKEQAIYGANSTMPDEARMAIAKEVHELTDVLVQMGNTNYQGRYVFSGHQTNVLPLTRDGGGVTYHGDQGAISWEVAPSVTIRANIDGQDLFFNSGMFAAMDQLEQGLINNDNAIITATIDLLGAALDHVLDKRAALGAISNGLDMTREKYLSENINFTELRSRLEDIDLAETYMNFAMLENIYTASLSMGARIIQPSLLDFLR